MIAPLGILLSDSWSSFRRVFATVFIGAVIFGLILGVGQSLVGQRVAQQADSTLGGLGIDMQQIQDLQQRMQAGDEAAFDEFAVAMQQFGGSEEQQEMLTGAIFSMYKKILPMMGVSMLLMWVICLIASAYFLLIALNEKATFQEALGRVPSLIIPLLLLSLWIFMRTFVWIPFIGIITGIILGPRFVLSPVLLVRDHKGVLESAKLSYAKTGGFWGKIFGNMIVACALGLIAQVLLGFILALLGMRIASLLLPVAQMLITAFITIFVVKLALTVEQHPQRV
ncbi:MAG: hypothetical protein PHO92_00905 [Candidatus Peribacteraceae bacterium]|nr:hypothetical protein [Candidatus Peribacteraceae bacterium]